MRKKLLLFAGIFMFAQISLGVWQHVVYAQYLYYFAKHVTFPLEKDKSSYKIGVLGSADMFRETRHMSLSKTVHGRVISVATVRALAEANELHMLFVGKDNTIDMKTIVNYCKVHHVLLVTDVPYSIEKGVGVQFLEDKKGNVKFKINNSICTESELQIHKTLLSMAYSD